VKKEETEEDGKGNKNKASPVQIKLKTNDQD